MLLYSASWDRPSAGRAFLQDGITVKLSGGGQSDLVNVHFKLERHSRAVNCNENPGSLSSFNALMLPSWPGLACKRDIFDLKQSAW